MPTPACFATSAIGADGLAMNTSRAATRIRSSLRAACARRPSCGVVASIIANFNGTDHSILIYLAERNLSFRNREPKGVHVDWKLELVQVPVSDVDRAKAFYVDQVGFNADHDHQVNDELRFVQLTPPGSACSIAIGTGLGQMAPGSVEGLQIVIEDADAARAALLGRGVE